jgi:hypothetical protein
MTACHAADTRRASGPSVGTRWQRANESSVSCMVPTCWYTSRQVGGTSGQQPVKITFYLYKVKDSEGQETCL